jgi:hypothetical protein
MISASTLIEISNWKLDGYTEVSIVAKIDPARPAKAAPRP